MSTDNNLALIDKFCNTSHPEPLTTPSNEVTLHFHSDEDGTDAGFQIHYSLVEGLPGCGGTYTGRSAEFGSPVEDGTYPHNLMCHYSIRLPKGNRIKLQFKSFELEPSSTCLFDYVEIYEGTNENDPKVGKWCGNQAPPAYESSSNELLVIFRSDFSSAHKGFQANYEIGLYIQIIQLNLFRKIII